MPDVLDQIARRQLLEQEQELAVAQHDLDWNATFGRMAPESVLRETRNMTALIANAVEKKMELAAQTNAEAQRIYINDQKWKAEQRMQPLKDERLIGQIRAGEARERATEAQERLATYRLERDATAVEHTASAQWEMDQIESAPIPEAEKRAWHNTVRGKYPFMDKDATARAEAMRTALNPAPAKLPTTSREWQGSDGAVYRFLPDGQTTRNGKPVAEMPEGVSFKATPKTPAQIEEDARARAAGTAAGTPPKPAKPDSFEQWEKDFKEEKRLHGDYIPPAVFAKFEARKTALKEASVAGAPAPAAVVNPRVALAQKALSDPNASEAHKAAARKILGQNGSQ